MSAERLILRVPRAILGSALHVLRQQTTQRHSSSTTAESATADTSAAGTSAGGSSAASPDAEVILEEQAQIVDALLSEDVQRQQVGELAEEPDDVRLEMAEVRAKHLAQERAEERALKTEST